MVDSAGEASVDSGRMGRFAAFVDEVEPRLRRALVAAYGPDLGAEATADALVWAWEHLERAESLANPAGYLWRVGQTSVRRSGRRQRREASWPLALTGSSEAPGESYEPGLVAALGRLTEHQRTAVLLVHGYGYPLAEAAAIVDCGVSSLRNHLARGLARLRADLGVDDA